MPETVRAAIVGSSGYTALELADILLRHPQVDLVAATSREPGERLAELHPRLAGRCDLVAEEFDAASLAERADCVFLCLPHGASAESAAALLEHGARVVDLSADYRLPDPALYERWYGLAHRDPKNLPDAAYGLTELFREDVRAARLLANPGCYPTATLLAMAPLLKAGAVETDSIIVDAKSGVSGAGRTPKLGSLYCEANESVAPYGTGEHRHQPEIEHYAARVAGKGEPVGVLFSPHLVPMDRGLLATVYLSPRRGSTTAELLDLYREFYAASRWVRVLETLPTTKNVAWSNHAHVSVRAVGGRVVAFGAIDNLLKGASGQAAQNMNVMFGFDEDAGLI